MIKMDTTKKAIMQEGLIEMEFIKKQVLNMIQKDLMKKEFIQKPKHLMIQKDIIEADMIKMVLIEEGLIYLGDTK